MGYNRLMLTRGKKLISGALIAAALLCVLPSAVFAAPYGNGAYDNCSYNCITTTSQPKTEVTLPSGLTVTINLSEGQKIPANGYAVVVQPASGQSGSLKSVDFYVDGRLQFTGSPNELGAVRWLYQPGEQQGDIRIKIIITGNDGTVLTKEFTVTIGTPDAPTTPSTSQDTSVVGTVSRAVLGFVGALPPPVLYGLPYFLFALLLGNIILLLIQTQREIREVATLQRIIELERRTGVEKNAFISLASHYLRTPLSIIQGGFDLLGRTTTMPASSLSTAQEVTDNLRNKVDTLLARSDAANQIAGVDDAQEHIRSAWKNPGLYLPILLIGLFAIAFDYVVSHVETFSVNQLNIIVQIVAFSLLAVVFYQAFRRRQLRTRDTKGMQAALTHEQTINQTRDELIAESATLLGGDLQQLRDIATAAPASQARDFILDGIARFRSVLVKFAIAGQLRGGHASQPKTRTSLSQLMNALPSSLTNRLARKKLTLVSTPDTEFAVQNPQLVTYVLASLIDNAAEYSPESSSIEVSANRHNSGTTITVTDHGPGISAEKISMLFRPFSQTQDVERFTHEGMGFSLYLDKLIMTYLNGSISLESKQGVATTASITLPT